MRVSDLIEKKSGAPVISFELSRPKSEKAAANLDKALVKLKAAGPDYVSVTFGAGGSTREGQVELLEKLQKEHNFETVAYIAGVGLSPENLAGCLDRFGALGIETVFAIRGDAPTWDEAWKPHPDALAYGSDLVAFIKERFGFCVGAAAYPEGHVEAVSKEKDLEYLKLKQDNGAEYIVAQYFYDNQFFFEFIEKARSIGVTVPIVPGVMPIYNVKMMNNLAKICGATITQEIHDGLAALPEGDKKAVSAFGVDFATKQCEGLLAAGVPGLHFYTMNRAKSVCAILDNLRSSGALK